MKEKILYLFLICILSPVSAKAPVWLTDTEKAYSQKNYITAVGEGENRHEAETDAVNYISLYFQTKTDIHCEAVREYNETAAIFAKSQSLTEHSVISSDAEFFCIHFTDPYFDEREKKFTVLAYIDRAEAAAVYGVKIDENMNDIHTILSCAEKQPEILYAAVAYKNAEIIAAVTGELIHNAVLVNPSSREKYLTDEKLLSSVPSLLDAEKNAMTFCVKSVSYDDRQITDTISSVLEKDGFSNSPDKYIYIVFYDLVFREEKHDTAAFVYPTLKISIQNKQKKVIESYSKVYEKCGHLNLEGAYTRAVMKITDDINKNFLSIYRSDGRN
ncbi:MAG: hypothetical protein M0P01_01540 [Treponema sp.]|nr:hypothetical protein [Treponema sp.]